MRKKFPFTPGTLKDLDYLKAYMGYVGRFWPKLLMGFLCIPLISIFHLLQPLLLKQGIDDHILTHDLPGLYRVSVFWGLCVLLEFLFRAAQSYLFQWIGIHSVTLIRRDLFRHILHLSSTYLDKTPMGTLVTRTTTDIEALSDSFASGVVTLLSDLMILGGILVAMFWLSPPLTGIILLSLPLLVIALNFFRKKMRHFFNLIRGSLGNLNASLKEQLEGVLIVQTFLHEVRNTKAFKARNSVYRDAAMHAVFYDSFLYSIVESASAALIGVMIWHGFGLHQEGLLTLGILVAFLDYLQKLFQPLKELSSKFATLQGALAALEKIFGAFAIKEVVDGGQQVVDDLPGTLAFKDVSFAYPGHTDKPVLQNISFQVQPGEVVAIVGPTGSGKTTISRLMAHLYAGYEGRIELGGVEIQELLLQSLRRRLAMVLQDVNIFGASVAYNISLGEPSISNEMIIEAAKRVQAHSFIEKLPQGYSTRLSAGGSPLSAGQAQLIGFARALCRDTDMIVLDEATASVDSLSERLIQQAIERIFTTKTVLVIAHRLSTIQKADRILAMKEGAIVEVGSHDELMALDGFYSKLFEMQFAHL